MHISRATNSRRTRYKTISGQEFFGQIEEMPGGRSDVNFLYPRRIIRVDKNCRLRTGSIFKSLSNQYYLCGSNASSEMGGEEVYRTFRIFEVAQKVSWKRFVKQTDPVTGIERNGTEQDLGEIFVSFEYVGSSRDSTKVSDPKYRLITAEDLMEGDIVGPHKVLRADKMLDLTIAEVQ